MDADEALFAPLRWMFMFAGDTGIWVSGSSAPPPTAKPKRDEYYIAGERASLPVPVMPAMCALMPEPGIMCGDMLEIPSCMPPPLAGVCGVMDGLIDMPCAE